jgi:hypothetical protein
MMNEQSLFKLELDVITPVPRTVTKHLKTLKVLRQWQKRSELDKNFYVLEYREYMFNDSLGQWERFAIFGTTLVPLSELKDEANKLYKSEESKYSDPDITPKQQKNKIILDACCGSRMFWFDKQNPYTIYADIRNEEHILCDDRKLEIHPDVEMDFTNIPYPDERFVLVILDPPHLKKLGESSWMAKKYGILPDNWQDLIKDGFNECMRVLKVNGVLIFKWNEHDIKINDIIEAIGRKPLFGHTTRKNSETVWMCFMKFEE